MSTKTETSSSNLDAGDIIGAIIMTLIFTLLASIPITSWITASVNHRNMDTEIHKAFNEDIPDESLAYGSYSEKIREMMEHRDERLEEQRKIVELAKKPRTYEWQHDTVYNVDDAHFYLNKEEFDKVEKALTVKTKGNVGLNNGEQPSAKLDITIGE